VRGFERAQAFCEKCERRRDSRLLARKHNLVFAFIRVNGEHSSGECGMDSRNVASASGVIGAQIDDQNAAGPQGIPAVVIKPEAAKLFRLPVSIESINQQHIE